MWKNTSNGIGITIYEYTTFVEFMLNYDTGTLAAGSQTTVSYPAGFTLSNRPVGEIKMPPLCSTNGYSGLDTIMNTSSLIIRVGTVNGLVAPAYIGFTMNKIL